MGCAAGLGPLERGDDGFVAPQHARESTSGPTPSSRASFAESLAGADSVADAARRRGLRRMKIFALGFLVGATVIFFICTWAQSNGAAPWIGYVRAAAEAGMVGALADWFAVTALFKHPLGIPIPHTAIIPNKKDQLGEGLGTFVRENFMSPEVVETKLRDAQVAGRMGKWLSEAATRRASGDRGVDGVARGRGDAARRGHSAVAGPDDRQAHRRTPVGPSDWSGAELAARGRPSGSADPAARRSGLPVVAQRGGDDRAGHRTRFAVAGHRVGSTA